MRENAGPPFPRSRSPEPGGSCSSGGEESAGRACCRLRKQLKTRADFHREQTSGRESPPRSLPSITYLTARSALLRSFLNFLISIKARAHTRAYRVFSAKSSEREREREKERKRKSKFRPRRGKLAFLSLSLSLSLTRVDGVVDYPVLRPSNNHLQSPRR